MYGAVGSPASQPEDINTSVMPITMIFATPIYARVYRKLQSQPVKDQQVI